MSPRSPPSPHMHPAKRPRMDKDSPGQTITAGPSPAASSEQQDMAFSAGASTPTKVGQSSSFRNVSACNRCRLRKNRCDQKLPSCASCEKANVACVGYDAITKREIPRSYVFYLENRVEHLESLLRAKNIPFPSADNLEYCSRMAAAADSVSVRSPTESSIAAALPPPPAASDTLDGTPAVPGSERGGDEARLQRLVSRADITQGKEVTANPRYLGSASGVSFARVVFAAVQSSVSENKSTSDKAGVRPSKPLATAGGGTTMRDSFFGLHTKPTINPAPFPDKDVATALVSLYFEHANPQIPILHRVEFGRMFEQAYDPDHPRRGHRELYMLNMVFAIGSGIIMGATASSRSDTSNSAAKPGEGRMSSKQAQPEEYHASAIVHLEACLNNSGGGLEELQAVLLLANFALLRPVPPGLWYIVGVAVRLAVDLGLHYEDGKDVDDGLRRESALQAGDDGRQRERGRREFVRDLRRRLWWSTYSFDRLVSICVGRPFGISDQVITTEFPSVLDDDLITPEGFQEPGPDVVGQPTYKLVAHHYFRLRLLQSEILQVLQYQQAQAARASGQNVRNPYMHTTLPSPFLSRFESFRSWRIDIDKRLYEWKMNAPTKQHTGVGFSTEFLDLNYWQAIVMLYRQSLSVPSMFEGEYNTSMEMQHSPNLPNSGGGGGGGGGGGVTGELREDEDRVYLKVAEAGQKIMRLYRQLHLAGVLNYTYLATHHIFMAGISYLYAIWHSPIVRSRLTLDEVDFTVLAATSVFGDLSEKCPPAEACRDAIDRTAKATIRMANSTGGFGQVVPPRSSGSLSEQRDWAQRSDSVSSSRGYRAPPTPLPHHHHQNNQQHHQHHQHQHQHHYNSNSDSPQTRRPSSQHQHGLPSISDVYTTHTSPGPQLPPIQTTVPPGPYRMNSLPNLKAELDGFSMMRNIPAPTRSNASDNISAAAAVAAAAAAAASAGSPETSAIDPSLLPTWRHILQRRRSRHRKRHSPNSSRLWGGGAGGLGPFGDLSAIGFLGGTGLNGADMDENAANVDLGFGLGWEGLHHDFSDGQQYDLFDGFFFGGQQGGQGGQQGNGGMGGANGEL
ncbi:hypothetical protein M406DRAFT_98141 [Cryphonectria parasitica EP155]|uniref:Zn(2)-C6 fungal-type domain-containing protein n=1 Tax=Cryphonectria parasitica (strain ATCC 38755 / EP155) TaxID=660469 RepID=A0A9P4Y814_CRYP1|nr:uncharacterized protein M406DRAFT_98141 [Cryphonectria parasitica EP155]KAF3768057.1 hypothetical protein M406DRAFT_98141 [Cryphonectria parasitica EP155]